MKSRSEIWARVAEDVATLCSVSTSRDVETVTRRVATEGDTFFQVTLPQFAKDLERSLEARMIEPDMFVGFHRRNRTIGVGSKGKKLSHGTPVFLGDLMEKLFDDSYEVSHDEYLDLQNAAAASSIPLPCLFPPMLRIPGHDGDFREMAEAIMAIRQLCLLFGKEKELCSDSATEAAIEQYKSCDEELMSPFKTEG